MDETNKASTNSNTSTSGDSGSVIRDLFDCREKLQELARSLKLTSETLDSNMFPEDDEVLEDHEEINTHVGGQKRSRKRKANDEVIDLFSLNVEEVSALKDGDLQKQSCEKESIDLIKPRISNVVLETGNSSNAIDSNNLKNAEISRYGAFSSEIVNSNILNTGVFKSCLSNEYCNQRLEACINKSETTSCNSKILSSYFETLKRDLAQPISCLDKLQNITITNLTNSDGEIMGANSETSTDTSHFLQHNTNLSDCGFTAQEEVLDNILSEGNPSQLKDIDSSDSISESCNYVLKCLNSSSKIGNSVSTFRDINQETKSSELIQDALKLQKEDGNLIFSTADVKDSFEENNNFESLSHLQPSLVQSDGISDSSYEAIATRVPGDYNNTSSWLESYLEKCSKKYVPDSIYIPSRHSKLQETVIDFAGLEENLNKIKNSMSYCDSESCERLQNSPTSESEIELSEKELSKLDKPLPNVYQAIDLIDSTIKKFLEMDSNYNNNGRIPDSSHQTKLTGVSDNSIFSDDYVYLEEKLQNIFANAKDCDIAGLNSRLQLYLESYDRPTAIREFIADCELRPEETTSEFLKQPTSDHTYCVEAEGDIVKKFVDSFQRKNKQRNEKSSIDNVETANRDRGICIGTVETTNRDRGICIGSDETKKNIRTSTSSYKTSDIDSDVLVDIFKTTIKCHPIKKFEIPPYASINAEGIWSTTGVKPEDYQAKQAWSDMWRYGIQNRNILEGCSDIDSDSIVYFEVTDCFSQDSSISCDKLITEYLQFSSKVSLLLIKPVKNLSDEEYELRLCRVRALDDEVGYFYGKLVKTNSDWRKQYNELRQKMIESRITSRDLHHMGVLRICVKLVGTLRRFTLREMMLELEHYESALVYKRNR